ncbi:MAG: hypothetical protein MJE68_18040 [Proteobacteria bacterium]|nr:hypothetical protein [Pseudomonadota bacterium]
MLVILLPLQGGREFIKEGGALLPPLYYYSCLHPSKETTEREKEELKKIDLESE